MFRIRHTIPILLLALAGGHVAAADGAPAGNILLVSIDTLRADHLGCYGYARDTSPNIDALAGEAVFFEQCLTPLATTLPAHMSLLTGVYPIEHGILANVRGKGGKFVRSTGLRSFAEFAQERGYATAAFVSAAPVSRATGIAAGFETFDEPEKRQRIAEVTNERVLAWLDGVGEKPFFLWVHYFDPHTPYSPPEPYLDRYRTDDFLEVHIEERGIPEEVNRPNGHRMATRPSINYYDGEIRYVDHHLGKLLERLEAPKLRDRTTVILLSDHGEGLGDHGMGGHGYVHREQLHVPLMIRAPGVDPRKIRDPMSLVDVLPTMIGLLGQRSAWKDFLKQASGRDLTIPDLAPEPVFSQRSARERDDLAGSAFALATIRWKLLYRPGHGDSLFDWADDPFELRNVISRPGGEATANELRTILLQRIGRHENRRRKLGPDDAGEASEMDPELLEKLRSLGYVD